jgi:hypothetical protein
MRVISDLRRLFADERGLTFPEAMMGSAISALVMGVLVISLYQFGTLTRLQRQSLDVNEQIQAVASMLNRDVVSATSGTVQNGALALSIPEYTFAQSGSAVTTTVVYSLVTDPEDTDRYQLRRTVGQDMTVIARQIDGISFGDAGDIGSTLTVTLSAPAPGNDGASRNTVMSFHRRPCD